MLSTSSDVKNGPISTADFDKNVGTGAAATYHFQQGYDITYDSTSSNESIEVTLLAFESATDASHFVPAILLNVGAASLAPTRSTLSTIPGSTVLTSTKAGSDGFYVIDIVAQKGNIVMVLEYANDSAPTGVPTVLSTSAQDQYSRL
jgi:hypothetical protein